VIGLRRALWVGLLALLAAPLALGAVVRFPGRTDGVDRRIQFPTELLALCLAKSGAPHRLALVDARPPSEARAAALRGEIDVMVMLSNATRTEGLVPLRMPLRRGLLGVRLLLARPEHAQALMDVTSLDALKRDFRLGYGETWMDRTAMQGLGFRMAPARRYVDLFDGLRAGRFDYLSRGVNELHAELADPRLAGRGMVVVPGIALFYPLDHYFWLPPGKAALAADIERGFRRALADGSYAALFVRFHFDMMRDARMHERSIIHVVDYPVPPGTPLQEFDILQLTSSRGSLAAPDAPMR
jgi:hypothetical protein